MEERAAGADAEGKRDPPPRALPAGKRKATPPQVSIDSARRFNLSRPLRFIGATARLVSDAAPLLDVIARILRENPEVRRVQIRAHWDSSVSPESAVALTQGQAEAIRAALVSRGVAAERMVAIGLGSSEPLPAREKHDLAARARNRRVELVVDPAG